MRLLVGDIVFSEFEGRGVITHADKSMPFDLLYVTAKFDNSSASYFVTNGDPKSRWYVVRKNAVSLEEIVEEQIAILSR